MSRDQGAAPRAFVVFGDDWGRHVSTMQHVFGRVARTNTVIWLNAIGHREPGLNDVGRAFRKIAAMLKRTHAPSGTSAEVADAPQPPQHIVQPRVLPWHSIGPIAALNRWSLKREIRRALTAAGVEDFVMVTGSPPSARVVGENGERASIYFCMDDFLVLPGTSPKMLAPFEQELLRRVDAVVATAQRLVEKKVAASGRGYQLPQGVNYEHFSKPREIPAELRSLPRPIIGFAGGVGAGVDVDSVQAIAAAIPTGSVVLVGPVTAAPEAYRRDNIHLLGPRPYAQLPAYVQAFDVGIIPYVDNDWMRAVDPLKLLEYLAAGVPVVASPLPEIRKYADAVTIAPLGAPFAAAVVDAVTNGKLDRDGRQRVAASHSWDRRAERFLEIVDEVCAEVGGETKREEIARVAR